MSFSDIIGHSVPIDLLRRAIRSGRLPHALLFHGPEGVGKGTVARALASAVLCESGDDDACGLCAACLKVRKGTHLDLLIVRRLPKRQAEPGEMSDEPSDARSGKGSADLSPNIRIFQIRQLAEHATYAPREGRHRVFILDPADRMNAESQNALLKTLEEPPGRSILILVASRPHLLLSTVRSRCLSVGFAPLPVPKLAEHLASRGFERDEALTRAALAGGRAGRALDLDLDKLRARRESLLSALESLSTSPRAMADLTDMASGLAGRDEETLLEGLELLESLLRDAARAATGPGGSILHADLIGRLEALGGRLGPERAGDLVRAVERVRGYLRFHVNRNIAAESLLAAVAGGPLP